MIHVCIPGMLAVAASTTRNVMEEVVRQYGSSDSDVQ
jgi:hypothetical protein